jgi:pyruvate,water dikinase
LNNIVTFKNPKWANDVSAVGGKAMNLFKLSASGCGVPPFIALSTACFNGFIKSMETEFNKALDNLKTETPAAIAKSAAELRSLFKAENIDKTLSAEIIKSVRDNIGNNCYLSVRSSATTEDSKDFSYAGQLDSFLFRKTDSEIIEAVAACWASGYSDRAVAYRDMKKISQRDVKVAVVIQKMVNGSSSGVTFTVNPITQVHDEMLISAAYGLGEGLVSGELDSDQYICKKSDIITIDRKEIVSKKEKVVFDSEKGYGTKKEAVGSEFCEIQCLSDQQVLAIAAICRKIEAANNGVPQDIEWSVDIDNPRKIYILQTRPITTLTKLSPSKSEYKTIWDNSNIVESYSGITSPLTFSFALNAYHMVYVQFCEVLKVPREKIINNDFYFANMLGLLNGRVYYNIKNWCRLISVLPGYHYNRRFMEQMMGVKSKIDFTPDTETKGGFLHKYFVELPRLLWSGANLAWQFFTIEDKVNKFMKIYQDMFDKYQKYKFNSAEAHDLVSVYYELENGVLRNWKAPIVNDFMAMIFYGILRMLIDKWGLNEGGGSLQNELVAGQGDVESTLPLKKLQQIARFIKTDEALADIFKKSNETTLTEMFVYAPRADYSENQKKLCAMIADYLEEFGYRSMNELKLEEPPLMDKPQFVFSILKNYTACTLPENEGASSHEKELREKAERLVAEKLSGKRFFGVISKLAVFNFIVNNTKRAVAFREYQRFARTKMFGLARRIFVGIGHRLVDFKVIDHADDVFYLTKDEIFSYVAGTATIQNLRELINLRKKEYDEYEKGEELPDRIETFGPVYCNDLNIEAPSDAPVEENTDPDLMKGLSCCPGVVRGKVKVILTPSDDMSLNGEILVAGRTDPGWVPLYPSASGLLIERGSILSHSAIVARELGLPAIVGISNITKKLKTGDEVEMDGAKGTIRIIRNIIE